MQRVVRVIESVRVGVPIVVGWLRAYWSSRQVHGNEMAGHWWRNFYALVWREFHILDIYTGLTRGLLTASARINVWLRWG